MNRFSNMDLGRLPGWVLAACVSWVLTAAVSVCAQGTTPVAQRMLADQLVILARQSLAQSQELRQDQLTRARLLLDLALELNSNDAQLWRLSEELAHQAGDQKTEYEALRRYCGLRPEDDAAQLKWMMGMVGLRQTLPQQMAVVSKILEDQESGQFSEALRSRLALYMAQAASETGDTEFFIRYLKDAVSLDRSNREAAKLAADWLEASGASADKVAETVMHLIKADPLNPHPRRRLARILLSHGAYQAAAKQYQVTQRLAGNAIDETFVYNWVLSVAGEGEIEDAVQLLAQYETIQTSNAPAAQSDQKPAPPPGLPMDLELLRLAILHQSGQRGRAQGSYQRLVSTLQKQLEEGDDDAQADLMWLGLLFDQTVPSDESLTQLAATRPQDDPLSTRLTGWAKLRVGDADAAQQILEAWYIHEDPFQAYGLAKAYQALDDPRHTGQLQHVIRLAPSNLAGVLAALDLMAQGIDSQPTRIGTRLARLIDDWPSRLASPNFKTDPWWQLTVHVEPKQYSYLDPISAKLTLRNMTDFSLSLGPDGVVPTDVLTLISLRRRGSSAGALPPLAMDMNRKIRLEPYEATDVTVRLDRAQLGLLFAASPAEAISADIKTVLDPQIAPNGRVIPGPMGDSDSVHLIERFATGMTVPNVEQWIKMLSDTEPERQMKAAALLTQLVSVLSDDSNEQTQEVVGRMIEAVQEAYDRWSPTMQAWVVRFLAQVSQENQDAPLIAIHESAQRSEDALVWVMYLATQVNDPDATALNTALRHADERVVAFANALRDGLKRATADPESEAELEPELEPEIELELEFEPQPQIEDEEEGALQK